MDPVKPDVKPADKPPEKPKAEDHIGRLTALRGKVLDKAEANADNMDEVKACLTAIQLLNDALKNAK